jgi:hypothetical protein
MAPQFDFNKRMEKRTYASLEYANFLIKVKFNGAGINTFMY